MTRPYRYLLRMMVFLVIVAAGIAALSPRLIAAFEANSILNGMIILVLLIGIGFIFRMVILLNPEVAFLNRLRRESSGSLVMPGQLSEERAPRLLGPMATMLGERKGRLTISATSMRTLLDGIQSRIEEAHDISRYLIGLLVFLGLLGTFWGLLETVNAVGDTISGLSGGTGDPASMFEQLKLGLQTPLSGMGTAFSSSLFGLAGSLVLGFLELQATQAHNRFVNDLEEWLSGITRLTGGGPVGDGEQSVPAYIQALLEQTADSLDNLQRIIARGEEGRTSISSDLTNLTERLGVLADQMRTEQQVMMRLAESQSQLRPILARLAEVDFSAAGGGGLDETTRDHIRNMDFRIERLVSEVSQGRREAVEEIRSEIRLVARTIAALAEEAEQG
jgi:hypothetical protein